MSVENIDFSNLDQTVDIKLDTSNKNPSLIDIDKLLGVKLGASEKIVTDKESFYKEDAEFKSGVGKCMVMFENFEGRDLAVCNNYFEKFLLEDKLLVS